MKGACELEESIWWEPLGTLDSPCLAFLDMYRVVVNRGPQRRGAYTCTVARRGGMAFALVGLGHFAPSCPWCHLFRLVACLRLLCRPQSFFSRWCKRAVTEWGVVILYGDSRFVMRIISPEWDAPHSQGEVRTVCVGTARVRLQVHPQQRPEMDAAQRMAPWVMNF